jgi:hypothetical protein
MRDAISSIAADVAVRTSVRACVGGWPGTRVIAGGRPAWRAVETKLASHGRWIDSPGRR